MVFEDIYREYWDKIYRLCRGYAGDKDWAKDITQETFVIVWQQLPNFRHESSVGTWIFRIACNNCLRQMEKDRRLPKRAVPMDGETDRLLISLELENVAQAQIALILGLSETNTRVRLHRIREKIKNKFIAYGTKR